MLLAIDTATRLSGLALYDDSGPLAEAVWDSGRNHTAQLLPQLDLMLRQIGASRGDLRAVAVGLGPGSWSGLRVGLSLAKGMALAGGLKLLGVGTLEALAYQHERGRTPIYPLIQLGRERYASAEFGPGGGRPQQRGPLQSGTLAEICSPIGGKALFCGDIDGQAAATLRALLGDRASFPAPAGRLRRPAFLAELAWQRLQAGGHDDLATLEPIYLGEPVKPKA